MVCHNYTVKALSHTHSTDKKTLAELKQEYSGHHLLRSVKADQSKHIDLVRREALKRQALKWSVKTEGE